MGFMSFKFMYNGKEMSVRKLVSLATLMHNILPYHTKEDCRCYRLIEIAHEDYMTLTRGHKHVRTQ